MYSYHAWPKSYDHRPSHPYNAGTEHVGFFTDQADIGGTAAIKNVRTGDGVVGGCVVLQFVVGLTQH